MNEQKHICQRVGCGLEFTPRRYFNGREKFCSSYCRLRDYNDKNPKTKTMRRLENKRHYETNRSAILKQHKQALRCECSRVRYKGELQCSRCKALPTASNFLPKELGD